MPDDIPDTSIERARAAIERLEKALAAHPGDSYLTKCLVGWRRELATVEREVQQTQKTV